MSDAIPSRAAIAVGDRVAWIAPTINFQWKQWPATVMQIRGEMALITLDAFPRTGRDVPTRDLELLTDRLGRSEDTP